MILSLVEYFVNFWPIKWHKFSLLFACGLIFYACDREEINYDGTVIVPVAAFTYSNGDCLAPCEVVFANQSKKATSYEWDFGDGTPVVTLENPKHIYEAPGIYSVRLTAKNAGSSSTINQTITIKSVMAAFTFTSGDGMAPCQVMFTNLTIGATQFAWDFGDGTPPAYEENPTHIYEFPGEYKVTFIATGAGTANVDGTSQTVLINMRTFRKTFGEPTPNSEKGYSVRQTMDGGYILLGSKHPAFTSYIYLIKTDNVGNLVWEKTFDAPDGQGYSVQQTMDGGYILLGFKPDAGSYYDIYLIKTDNLGNLVWEKTFGGPNNIEQGLSVQQTMDGGYILLGTKYAAGTSYIYLIKTDNVGNLVWEKTFGGSNGGEGFSVQQTMDGGYILLGTTYEAGSIDTYLIKTDNVGNLVWEKTFGGPNIEYASSVQQTTDGGYILLGSTGDILTNTDMYIIKTDSWGDLIWEKTFGGPNNENGRSVQQTTDGGYILFGGIGDMFLIKTDNEGSLIWEKTFDGGNYDEGSSVQQTMDGGYILLGSTEGNGTSSDMYLIKTDEDGNAQ